MRDLFESLMAGFTNALNIRVVEVTCVTTGWVMEVFLWFGCDVMGRAEILTGNHCIEGSVSLYVAHSCYWDDEGRANQGSWKTSRWLNIFLLSD